MKKLMACLLAFLMIFSFAACGKAKEKAANEAAEKMIEGAGGGKVDIEGDKVTIKGESGENLTVGSTTWPTSELAKKIPEFKAGKITGVMDSPDGILVTMESVKEADAMAYFDNIKKNFNQESYEAKEEGSLSYGGKNADGIGVALQYTEGTLTVSVSKAAQSK
jgi:Cu/Ag efflux protein CusF